MCLCVWLSLYGASHRCAIGFVYMLLSMENWNGLKKRSVKTTFNWDSDWDRNRKRLEILGCNLHHINMPNALLSVYICTAVDSAVADCIAPCTYIYILQRKRKNKIHNKWFGREPCIVWRYKRPSLWLIARASTKPA